MEFSFSKNCFCSFLFVLKLIGNLFRIYCLKKNPLFLFPFCFYFSFFLFCDFSVSSRRRRRRTHERKEILRPRFNRFNHTLRSFRHLLCVDKRFGCAGGLMSFVLVLLFDGIQTSLNRFKMYLQNKKYSDTHFFKFIAKSA